MSVAAHSLGFPRIGGDRELKKAQEAYWAGTIDQAALEKVGAEIRALHWKWQAEAGLDLVPTGDFAWYDQVLTMSATVGNIPLRHRKIAGSCSVAAPAETADKCGCSGDAVTIDRFADGPCLDVNLDTLFRVARGRAPTGQETAASDMTKWFDTNYHYIVPEFHKGQTFALSWPQIIDETKEALAQGIPAKPVIIGPLTYLFLGKEKGATFDRFELLDALLPAYDDLIKALVATGVSTIQVDEPALSLDLPAEWRAAYHGVYERLSALGAKLIVATYFAQLDDNLDVAVNLPVAGLHVDAVRAPEELDTVIAKVAAAKDGKILSVGVVNGRNIWKNDIAASVATVKKAVDVLGAERVWVAPSCSLLHSPVDLSREAKLDAEALSWLAFAKQKLDEVATIKTLINKPDDAAAQAALAASNAVVESRKTSARIHNAEVKARVAAITDELATRKSPFAQRIIAQQAKLNLPLFPTTTIGSFPQTTEIRVARRAVKTGKITEAEYEARMKAEIDDVVKRQEEIGIDVLVHGEPERNDMVEYFGEQLAGYVFTQYGWVQSYGSRCVKPPIIFGDVSRPAPMTVAWSAYAQSKTSKPMKGMLTGPITMLFWSFVRDDQPRSTTAQQLALALRDEVVDLETAGINVIQIDEPAIREGLPLRKSERAAYLDWAVKAFRISASGVKDETQIHTHMCYSEFNDIIKSIAELDADKVTIECSRSQGELVQAFEDFKYPNHIGPGVYDIHSPNVPTVEFMTTILERAARELPVANLWCNPDCGLKTRKWEEVTESLIRMVAAAKIMREKYATTA